MELNEKELSVVSNNTELSRLYEEHRRLKRELEAYRGAYYLSPEDQMKEQMLKKEKLHVKDELIRNLSVATVAA